MERKRLLIDTSILIDHLRKTQKDKTIFYQLASQCDYLISAITEFEFLTDIFIAATAITYDLQLVTLNRKHFERVENLKLYI